tara:strand:- start:56 stop:280 length:225 start_codon:yes stop_codon:yes gene_type:complete
MADKKNRFPGDFDTFIKSKEFKDRKGVSHDEEVKAWKKYRVRTAKTRDEAKIKKVKTKKQGPGPANRPSGGWTS